MEGSCGVVGRGKEVRALKRYMGSSQQKCYGNLFVYGTPSTGKSHVVEKVLKDSGGKYTVVNCMEMYSPRVLYEEVLNSVSGCFPSQENMFGGYERCESMVKFVKHLSKIYDEQLNNGDTLYIVLDHVERLRKFKVSDLAAILRLQELVCENVLSVGAYDNNSSSHNSLYTFIAF
eukprot:m.83346 g.83346  ORF g.83346 m.83346 type:complete len:175 (-) comp12117_c1_seq1:1296-1820(-)